MSADQSTQNGDDLAKENRRRINRQLEVERAADRMSELRKRIGKRYENCHFDNFELSPVASVRESQTMVINQLRRYTSQLAQCCTDGSGLGLIGTVGTGKDHLMAASMMVAVGDGHSVEWRDGAALCREFHSVIEGVTTEHRVLAPLFSCDILAISDLLPPGAALNEFVRSKLLVVIDQRYRDMKPIWWSINETRKKDAESRMSPPIWDRLTDGGLMLSFDWPSHRETRRWTGAESDGR